MNQINLDINKSGQIINEPVVLRVGDKDQTITVNLLKDGQPYTSFTTATFFANKPSGSIVANDPANISNGVITYTVPQALVNEFGKITNAYFLIDGKTSTESFVIAVLQGVNISDDLNDYIPGMNNLNVIYDKWKAKLQTITDELAGIDAPKEVKNVIDNELKNYTDQINELQGRITALKTQLDALEVPVNAVGTNLYTDTRDFDNPSVWSNWSYWNKTGEKYNGLAVMGTSQDWYGLEQAIQAKKGETYTFSAYARYQSGTGKSAIYYTAPKGSAGVNVGTAGTIVSLNETWQRISGTVKVTSDGLLMVRIERSPDNTNTILIAGPKLEKGSIATDYSVNPLDYLGKGDVTNENILPYSGNWSDTTGWTLGAWGASDKTLSIVNHNFYHNGVDALLYIQTVQKNTASARSLDFTLIPSTTYTFSFWGFSSGNVVGTNVYVLGRSYTSTNDYDFTHNLFENLKMSPKGITKYTATFKTGPTETQAYVRLDNTGSNDGKSAGSYFAELKLEQGDIATPYTRVSSSEFSTISQTVDDMQLDISKNFVASKDGAPIYNAVDNTLDFNCYTDQAYLYNDGQTYQFPKNAKITINQPVSGGSSVRFIIKLSTMEMKAIAWNTRIPFGWSELAAIRKTVNNEVLVTANFPITIRGASFKSYATVNAIDAKIKGICHRGFNRVAPEESKAAYLLAKQNGYLHWEGDINWTKDNVPMMIHDLAINRTGRNLDGSEISANTNITDILYKDLADFDFGIVKGERFKGEPLLTFEQLVKLARYNDTFLHIEFKYAFTQEQVQTLHNIVVKYNMLDRIAWQAFGWNWLKPMMELEPNGQYELLGGDVTDDYFTKMAALKTNTNTIVASQSAALSVDDIQKIADKGYPIYLWPVDDGGTVRKFRDIGMVEGIMTNGNINVADELTK